MKEVTVHILEVLLAGLILIFALNFLLSLNGGTGILGIIGTFPAGSHQAVSEGRDALEEIQSMPLPVVSYAGGACVVGQDVNLKSLFEVYLPGEDAFYNGRQENGFRITIKDIQDRSGDSCMSDIDAALGEYSDELASPLSYDPDTGIICFHQSGSFRVTLIIYGEYGRSQEKVFQIPVEAG